MSFKYPIHLLEPIEKDRPIKGFRFKPAVAFLLSELAGVEYALIRNCKVYSRTAYRYLPWYSAKKGGGAITLGNKNWQSITYTENFFSDDKSLFPHSAYLNNLYTWLNMSSHEVGHLSHAMRYRSLIIYLIVFMIQYTRFGHDEAPLEHEANIGSDNFKDFYRYISMNGQSTVLSEILENDKDEDEKIRKLGIILSKYHTKKTLTR